ncbi:hypothetical protein DERF_006605 [Dermatophagoides farinae]|uniref:Uncharacterized protein n=1 Tax=Dermatophagoides farinae TaxID=6954 RepID=A0A922L3P9_DERFA|nr:hypothetical protein DERF_006605 [Dermatophagoides farinae]
MNSELKKNPHKCYPESIRRLEIEKISFNSRDTITILILPEDILYSIEQIHFPNSIQCECKTIIAYKLLNVMINPAMAIYDNHRKDIGIPKIINNDQEQDG